MDGPGSLAPGVSVVVICSGSHGSAHSPPPGFELSFKDSVEALTRQGEVSPRCVVLCGSIVDVLTALLAMRDAPRLVGVPVVAVLRGGATKR